MTPHDAQRLRINEDWQPNENTRQFMLETEQQRAQRLQHAQEQAERCIEWLHREYFEPFDSLLERKAEYALKVEQEKGEIPARLLKEIEIMEKFRAYVDRLEYLQEDQAFAWFVVMDREIKHLQRRCNQLNELALTIMDNEKKLIEQFLMSLRKIQNLEKNGTGTNRTRQD